MPGKKTPVESGAGVSQHLIFPLVSSSEIRCWAFFFYNYRKILLLVSFAGEFQIVCRKTLLGCFLENFGICNSLQYKELQIRKTAKNSKKTLFLQTLWNSPAQETKREIFLHMLTKKCPAPNLST